MTNRNDWETSISVVLNDFSKERMADLQGCGIQFMELTSGDLRHYEDFSEKSKGIFKTAADYGVKIRSVHLPFEPFGLIDPASKKKELRDKFLEIESEITKISAERGTEIMIVHPSAEPYSEELRPEHLKYTIEELTKLNEVAKNAGVILAVENLPRTCMGRDCYDIAKIAAEIPDVHFCFDSNHSLKDSNVDIIKTMGEKIVATHISDYDFINERHLFPGEGKVIWQEIMAALEDVGYNGTWNYEIRDCSSIPAAEFENNHLKLLSGEIA